MSDPRNLPIWNQEPIALVPVEPGADEPTEEEMDEADADDALVFEALKEELEALRDPDTLVEFPSCEQILATFPELAGENDDDPA